MADRFRAAVNRKVLGACRSLQILLIVALDALNKAYAHAGSQIRILAKGFMTASPARVAENIDIGRPERKSLVNVRVVLLLLVIVLGASFCGNDIGHLLQQLLVKACRHRNRLRKYRRDSGTGNTVQTLVPPVICLNPQLLDRRRPIQRLLYLLVQRHLRDQFLCLPAVLRKKHFIFCYLHLPFPPHSDNVLSESFCA